MQVTELAFQDYLADLDAHHAGLDDLSDEEHEELLETALYHGLNLIAGFAKYSLHSW